MSDGMDFDYETTQTEGGLLAKLWRTILVGTNFIRTRDQLVNEYVRKTDMLKGRVKQVSRKTKSTLTKNVNANEMTWKVFIDLLFNFITVKKIDISIKLTMSNGKETLHSLSIVNTAEETK